jgi:hypothetical protein
VCLYPEASIALDIPLLCGDTEAAREASTKLLGRDRPSTTWGWWEYRAKYLAGQEPEQEFLARVGPFSDLACIAHYTVAIKALTDGYRRKAEKQETLPPCCANKQLDVVELPPGQGASQVHGQRFHMAGLDS